MFPLNNVARQLTLRPAFAVSVAAAGPWTLPAKIASNQLNNFVE